VVLIVQNAATIDVQVFNSHWHVHAYWLAVAGLAITAVFVVGLRLSKAGMVRSRRRRRERRELVRENRRLAEQVETAPPTGPAATAPPDEPKARYRNTDGANSQADV
jgi:hypothetical protein